jgi:hypothetical protein
MHRVAAPNDSAGSNAGRIVESSTPIQISDRRPAPLAVTDDPGLDVVMQQTIDNSGLHGSPLLEQEHPILKGVFLSDISYEGINKIFPKTSADSASESAIDGSEAPLIDQRHPVNQRSTKGMTDADMMDPSHSQSTLDATTSGSALHYSQEQHTINSVARRTRSSSRRRAQNDQILARRNASERISSERNVSGTKEQKYLELSDLVDLQEPKSSGKKTVT